MSFPYTPNVLDEKAESLRNHHEFLHLLRLRHLQWMNTAGDEQAETMHLEIAELIEQLTDRYNHLLTMLEK